jgi:SNF2 family DNA or RNA helicase
LFSSLLVTDLFGRNARALVFTQFRETGELLTQHITDQFGFDAPFLHGGVTRTRRDTMVDLFQDRAGHRCCSCRRKPAAPGSTSPQPAK